MRRLRHVSLEAMTRQMNFGCTSVFFRHVPSSNQHLTNRGGDCGCDLGCGVDSICWELVSFGCQMKV